MNDHKSTSASISSLDPTARNAWKGWLGMPYTAGNRTGARAADNPYVGCCGAATLREEEDRKKKKSYNKNDINKSNNRGCVGLRLCHYE